MADSAKFKLNLRTREVEIEGSEEFVERQIQQLETIFEFLARNEPEGDSSEEEASPVDEDLANKAAVKTSPKSGDMPATFGEWMHSFKAELNDLDKALITARFVQAQSTDNDFKTSEVNNSLKEHGIKLSNPSVTLKRLGDRKFLFQTRKVGKLRYMRVSTEGQKHLESLKAQG